MFMFKQDQSHLFYSFQTKNKMCWHRFVFLSLYNNNNNLYKSQFLLNLFYFQNLDLVSDMNWTRVGTERVTGMSCVKDGPWSPEHTSDFSQRLCVCVCVCVVSSGLLFKALWLDETPDHIKLQIMLSWICSGLHILTYLWRMIDRSGFISPETAS